MLTVFTRHKLSQPWFFPAFGCLILGAMLYVFYYAFGHQIIAALYTAEPESLLTHLLQRRSVVPVSFYIEFMDKNAHKLLFLPVATFLFYFGAYKAYAFLLKEHDARPTNPAAACGRLMGSDLALALVLYVLLVFAFFFPLLPVISSSLIGPPEDNMKYLWNMWWGYKSIVQNIGTLTYSNHIFFPEGSSLLYNDYSWYNLAASFLLGRFLGPAATYNVLILHTFVIAGVGAFMLARYLTGNPTAAVIAGFIYAFNPSHFAHSLHHMNIASIQFIPFFVLFFLRSVREKSWANVALASLMVLLNALCDWNYLIASCLFMGFAYVFAVATRRSACVDLLWKIAAIVIGPAVIVSPWLLEMISLGLRADVKSFHIGHNMYVADLVGLVAPHSFHSLGTRPPFDAINRTFTGNPWESAVYLGVINLICVGIAFRRIIAETSAYFCGLLSFLILSLGSFVHVLGNTMPIPLPYNLFVVVPFLSHARAPSRLIVFVYLFLSIIVAFAIRHFMDHGGGHALKKHAVALLGFLILADYYSAAFESTQVSMPYCYTAVAQGKGDGGILELPGGLEENSRYMMYQTYHRMPIVQGAIPRKIGTSLIDRLHRQDLQAQRQQLVDSQVEYIFIHKKPIVESRTMDTVPYRKHYATICEDERTVLFKVS